MKIYLVRHGCSVGYLPGRMSGWSDHPLGALGAAQARRVAQRLASLGPMPVYSSDLSRALETARIIADAWGVGETSAGVIAERHRGDTGAGVIEERRVAEASSAPIEERRRGETSAGVIADRRLREICLGSLEGQTWADFLADKELTNAFESEPFTTELPGGESVARVRERVLAAFHEIVAGTSAVVCVVAHDGPIRALVNHVLKVPPERHFTLSTSHGGLSLLETDGDWVSVRFLNDTSHLDDLDTSVTPESPSRPPAQ